MCIALVSTAHPSYSLIIVDNRDVCETPPLHVRIPRVNSMPRNIFVDQHHPQNGGQSRIPTF